MESADATPHSCWRAFLKSPAKTSRFSAPERMELTETAPRRVLSRMVRQQSARNQRDWIQQIRNSAAMPTLFLSASATQSLPDPQATICAICGFSWPMEARESDYFATG